MQRWMELVRMLGCTGWAQRWLGNIRGLVGDLGAAMLEPKRRRGKRTNHATLGTRDLDDPSAAISPRLIHLDPRRHRTHASDQSTATFQTHVSSGWRVSVDSLQNFQINPASPRCACRRRANLLQWQLSFVPVARLQLSHESCRSLLVKCLRRPTGAIESSRPSKAMAHSNAPFSRQLCCREGVSVPIQNCLQLSTMAATSSEANAAE